MRKMSKERKAYPTRPEEYELMEEVGEGVSASVYRALCVPLNEIVAVKVLDLERQNCDLNNVAREAQTMFLIDHPNVLKAHCSFTKDHYLWVVMPYMEGGSFLHILKTAYNDGLEEVVIATVLRDVLRGLEYLHNQGHIHRDVKAGNILVDSRGSIRLGDFGVSTCQFDSGDRINNRTTLAGTPYWMAPEVLDSLHGYNFKADIWSFGITALELAHGHAPFSKYPAMKVFVMTLKNAPPSLDYERDKKFSKSFRLMIAKCLIKDPSKRYTAHKLLKHSFFKQARSGDYIARTIILGLPPLGERIQALKEKDVLAQKKIVDGVNEARSQFEYKKFLSAWQFDDELSEMWSRMVRDVESSSSEKENGQSTNVLLDDGSFTKKISPEMSSACSFSTDDLHKEKVELLLGKPFPDQNVPTLRCEPNGSDETININGLKDPNLPENGSPFNGNGQANFSISSDGSDHDGKLLKMVNSLSFHERKVSTDVSFPSSEFGSLSTQHSSQNTGKCNEVVKCDGVVPQPASDLLFESIAKSNPSGCEDFDTKSKTLAVQQKGRFKVTSENVELEMAPPSPILPKSHSVQVICQVPVTSLCSPSDCRPDLRGSSIFLQLIYILKTNFVQRGSILNLMKQLIVGEPSAARADETCSDVTEKLLFELAGEREKELLRQVTDLKMRLTSAQEELQKLKPRKTQL